MDVVSQSTLYSVECIVSMGDEGSYIYLSPLNQIQSARINRRSTVALETSGRAHGSDERRLSEHHIIEHTEIDAGVPMAIKQDGALLTNQARQSLKPRAR